LLVGVTIGGRTIENHEETVKENQMKEFEERITERQEELETRRRVTMTTQMIENKRTTTTGNQSTRGDRDHGSMPELEG
jgi:hypothetical protein